MLLLYMLLACGTLWRLLSVCMAVYVSRLNYLPLELRRL